MLGRIRFAGLATWLFAAWLRSAAAQEPVPAPRLDAASHGTEAPQNAEIAATQTGMFHELLELNADRVTTASKAEEAIEDAPASISVITAAEIQRFGATRLIDVLDRFLGAQGMSTYFFKNNHLAIRGQAMDHRDKLMLFLIDGRPVRESLTNGESVPLYVAFPLQRIARIEFIRGPGSVLYGTQAVLGTVNIVTKHGAAQETGSNMAFAGDGIWRAEAATGLQLGDLQVALGANYLADTGPLWDGPYANYPNALATTRFLQWERAGSANLRLDYKNLTVLAHYGSSMQRRVSVDPWPENPFGEIELIIRRATVDLGYRLDWGPRNQATLDLTFNHHSYAQPRLAAAHDARENGYNNDLMLEYTHAWSIFDDLKLTAGATGSLLSGTIFSPSLTQTNGVLQPYDIYTQPPNPHPDINLPPYTEFWYSFYAQLTYHLLDRLQLSAGAQVNKVNGLPFDVTPRAAVIVHATENLTVKALYGEAFRSPSFFERYFSSVFTLQGNSHLAPEKVRTAELLLNYRWLDLAVNLAGYYTWERNIIARVPLPSGLQGTVNVNQVTARGAELELRYPVLQQLFLTGSAAYNDVLDQNGESPFGLSNFVGKLGGTYLWSDWGSIGWFNALYAPGRQFTAAHAVGVPVHGYVWGTFKVSADLAHLLQVTQVSSVKAYVLVENLYGARVHIPEYNLKNIRSIPGRLLPTFWGGVEVTL